MTLDKKLSHYELQFPHLENGYYSLLHYGFENKMNSGIPKVLGTMTDTQEGLDE